MFGFQSISKISIKCLPFSYASTFRLASTAPLHNSGGEAVIDASTKKTRNSIVAAAFESLNTSTNQTEGNEPVKEAKKAVAAPKLNENELDEHILRATTVNSLLALSERNATLSRKHALKIVSILAEWNASNKVQLNDFENDARFVGICTILGNTEAIKNKSFAQPFPNSRTKNNRGLRMDDLNTVLGVAGDDEAAKLIASISLPQMVKVLVILAQRKRRSTPLLRSLSFNISSSTETLDLKQCSDILFSMAVLNFKDPVLITKTCSDIQACLPKNTERSAVIGSILTSLGILKYRNLEILESLTQWILTHKDICRSQDLSALVFTSATLNFKSEKIDDIRSKLLPIIGREDLPKPVDWLNHVLALAMLGLANNSHLESVLSERFIKELQTEKLDLPPITKMKLLKINSFAQLLATDYSGSLIPADSVIHDVQMAHVKSKQILINGIIDALKTLLPSNHIQTAVDSKMGFIIDAICSFDANCNPLPLDREQGNAIKVAIMAIDFHDICQGINRSVCGLTTLSFELLEKKGYAVLPVPYNEFNNSEKLLKRVQYLDGKIKSIIRNK